LTIINLVVPGIYSIEIINVSCPWGMNTKGWDDMTIIHLIVMILCMIVVVKGYMFLSINEREWWY